MTEERVFMHGTEVRPGQVWKHIGGGAHSAGVVVTKVSLPDGVRTESIGTNRVFGWWTVDAFAQSFRPAGSEPDARWTDARWAEEQVALARRQADAARAEARALSALVDELREALDASQKARVWAEQVVERVESERDDARRDLTAQLDGNALIRQRFGALPHETMGMFHERVLGQYRAEVGTLTAERDRLRAIVEADGELAGEASEAWAVLTGRDVQDGRPEGSCVTEARRVVAELAEARAALEAARAAVHTPSPGGSDPAPKTRLPVVPATCGECRHYRDWECRHPERPWPTSMLAQTVPSPSCPIRAELAKAGGA